MLELGFGEPQRIWQSRQARSGLDVPLLLTSEVGGKGYDQQDPMAFAAGPDIQSAQVPTFSVVAFRPTISEAS